MAEKKGREATQFVKGVSGNPGGKTKAQRADELKAAEISAKMRLKILTSMQAKFEADEIIHADYELLLSTGALKLFKDSEDRAHGTPKQYVDSTSSDGSMTPTKIVRELVHPKKPKSK
jgi:methylase of polypeptide subunit release factors